MMPATCVPWPEPRSVLEYGPWSIGTTIVFDESGGTLAYSAETSFTLWVDVVGEVGVGGVAAGVDDGDGHALAGEPGGAGRGGAHGVGRRGVEQLDRARRG